MLWARILQSFPRRGSYKRHSKENSAKKPRANEASDEAEEITIPATRVRVPYFDRMSTNVNRSDPNITTTNPKRSGQIETQFEPNRSRFRFDVTFIKIVRITGIGYRLKRVSTELSKRVPGACTRGGNCSSCSNQLYRLSILRTQAKKSGDEHPRLRAPLRMPAILLFLSAGSLKWH